VVLRLVVALLAISWIAEWAIFLTMADSNSWKVALLEILTTGLLGIAVIRHTSTHFRRRLISSAHAGEPLGNVVIDGTILLLAGALLLLPGIISDVAGLLLLVPPVRWLITAAWKRWYLPQQKRDNERGDTRG
jgi:UPF0716 protein FxsA